MVATSSVLRVVVVAMMVAVVMMAAVGHGPPRDVVMREHLVQRHCPPMPPHRRHHLHPAQDQQQQQQGCWPQSTQHQPLFPAPPHEYQHQPQRSQRVAPRGPARHREDTIRQGSIRGGTIGWGSMLVVLARAPLPVLASRLRPNRSQSGVPVVTSVAMVMVICAQQAVRVRIALRW